MYKKIVFESLNEVISFERGGDPLSVLGIGRRKLIEDWLEKMGIYNYFINKDLAIDVEFDVFLYEKKLIKFPGYIQFNNVYEDFYCNNNELISLKGSPKSCKTFNCASNQLTSLENCPILIYKDFICPRNKTKFTKENVKKLCQVQRNIYV